MTLPQTRSGRSPLRVRATIGSPAAWLAPFLVASGCGGPPSAPPPVAVTLVSARPRPAPSASASSSSKLEDKPPTRPSGHVICECGSGCQPTAAKVDALWAQGKRDFCGRGLVGMMMGATALDGGVAGSAPVEPDRETRREILFSCGLLPRPQPRVRTCLDAVPEASREAASLVAGIARSRLLACYRVRGVGAPVVDLQVLVQLDSGGAVTRATAQPTVADAAFADCVAAAISPVQSDRLAGIGSLRFGLVFDNP